MKIQFEDHSAEVLGALDAAVGRALEKCGLVAEGYAKKLCPVDTGNLRNSITYMVNDGEKAAYIGTNSEYAVYVECGTGVYYPGGRQTPWVYQCKRRLASDPRPTRKTVHQARSGIPCRAV